MKRYYLAIDIGASSGRHLLFHMEDGILKAEEVHRFGNGAVAKNGHLVWEIDRLFQEVLTGIQKCKEIGKIPVSVGIDMWGVDFVLLDDQGERIGDAIAYRDHRTDGIDQAVESIIPRRELYARTGIQKAIFNTVYQLAALAKEDPEALRQAETLLFLPDYLHYLLTGVKAAEYTEASTSSLLSADKCDWDQELLERLGFPKDVFPPIVHAGATLGAFRPEIESEVGYSANVVLPATHDTGSAFLAVPALSRSIYLSSGTWSLFGVENEAPLVSDEAFQANFTNEGGYQKRYRFLKNIMGLWMVQSVKKEAEERGVKASFGEISEGASKETIASIVPCNDNRFLSPSSMTEEIRNCCRETGQAVPETLTELAAVIYNSLAVCYADAVREIESITGETYDAIHVVGGGADAVYLNEITAKATGKTVLAGPKEATAIGNALVQLIADGAVGSLQEGRKIVRGSFPIRTYLPQ